MFQICNPCLPCLAGSFFAFGSGPARVVLAGEYSILSALKISSAHLNIHSLLLSDWGNPFLLAVDNGCLLDLVGWIWGRREWRWLRFGNWVPHYLTQAGVSILISRSETTLCETPHFSEFMENSAKFMKNSGLTKWTQNPHIKSMYSFQYFAELESTFGKNAVYTS